MKVKIDSEMGDIGSFCAKFFFLANVFSGILGRRAELKVEKT